MFLKKSISFFLVIIFGFSVWPIRCMLTNQDSQELRSRKNETVILIADEYLPNYKVKKFSDIKFDYNREAYIPVGKNGKSIKAKKSFVKVFDLYLPEDIMVKVSSNSCRKYIKKSMIKDKRISVGFNDEVVFNRSFILKDITGKSDLGFKSFELIVEEKDKPFIVIVKKRSLCKDIIYISIFSCLIFGSFYIGAKLA